MSGLNIESVHGISLCVRAVWHAKADMWGHAFTTAIWIKVRNVIDRGPDCESGAMEVNKVVAVVVFSTQVFRLALVVPVVKSG